ncbi:MAG TPA: helix-turn-helix domain-containing protein [Jatrophihabitantaceae bacterium]
MPDLRTDESHAHWVATQCSKQFFDAVNELTNAADAAALWVVLATSARDLIRADCGIVTLFDDQDSGSTIRAADGPVLESYWQMRCPPGYGLLGAVANSGRPRVTYDYCTDPSFAHTEDLDATVRGEGLSAHAAVPLKSGNQLIGVLYAADRHSRNFTSDEVTMLERLSRLAVGVLRRLKREEAYRTRLQIAASRLEESNGALHEVNEQLQHRDGLVVAVNAGRSALEYVRAIASFVDVPVSLVDPRGAVVGADLSVDHARAALVATDDGMAPGTRLTDSLRVWPLSAGPERLGALVSSEQPEGPAVDGMMRYAAGLVSALLAARTSGAANSARERSLILGELLTRESASSVLAEDAAAVGFELESDNVCLGIHVDGSMATKTRVASLTDRLLSAASGGAGVFRGVVVGIANGSDLTALANRLHGEISASVSGRVVIGVDGPAVGMNAIRTSLRRAKDLASLAAALNDEVKVVSAAELGFVGMVLSADSAANGAQYVRRTIGALLEYDRSRGSELVRTVEMWFANNGQLGPTAKQLMVHVNTVSQRLARVDNLLGKDWRQPARSLDIQVAVRLNAALVRTARVAG